jgi:PEGA domain
VRRPHRSAIYFIPAYGWPYPYGAATASATPALPDGSPTPPKPQPLPGRLRLDIEPGGAQQLYVDNYYVGTLEDFSSEVELEAGPHTIEIQAPGYETLHIDVMIAPGRSITYRGTLKTTDAKPAPEAAVPSSTSVTPATPMTLYFIPHCYIGNVPPQEVGLPASCDLARVITITR